MRVYILSDDRKVGISIANIVNSSGSSGIMSEGDHDDYKGMVADLNESKRSFDVAIMATRKPIAACLSANKLGGIKAAVCRDPDEAAEARESESNVIVVSSAEFDQDAFADMLENITGTEIVTEKGVQNSLFDSGRAMVKSAIQSGKKVAKTTKAMVALPKKEAEEDEEEEEEEEEREPERKGKKKESMFKQLKDSLGIKG